MKKISKRFNVSVPVVYEQVKREFPIELPEVVDIDVLATMNDDDLTVRLKTLDSERDRLFSQGFEPRPWENEIAYVKREQQIRRVRRDHHDRYMRLLAADVGAPEYSLPYADLDNSAYMVF